MFHVFFCWLVCGIMYGFGGLTFHFHWYLIPTVIVEAALLAMLAYSAWLIAKDRKEALHNR